MTFSIVYSSRTGNTAQLARFLSDNLPSERCLFCGPPAKEALAAQLIFVGFWTDKGTCDGETAAFLPLLHGKEAALFGTAGFGGDRDYFAGILQRAQSLLPQDCRCHPGFLARGRCPRRWGNGTAPPWSRTPRIPGPWGCGRLSRKGCTIPTGRTRRPSSLGLGRYCRQMADNRTHKGRGNLSGSPAPLSLLFTGEAPPKWWFPSPPRSGGRYGPGASPQCA